MSGTSPFDIPAHSAALDRAFVERFSERLLAVWNEHNTAALAELVTHDVVCIDPALDAPAHGVEGVRRFMETCWRVTPDLHFDITGRGATPTTLRCSPFRGG